MWNQFETSGLSSIHFIKWADIREKPDYLEYYVQTDFAEQDNAFVPSVGILLKGYSDFQYTGATTIFNYLMNLKSAILRII